MNDRTCKTDGCTEPRYAKGLCRREYEDDLKKRHDEGGDVAKRQVTMLTCGACGKEFKGRPKQVSLAAAGRVVFENAACRSAYHAARTITANCQTCGTPVKRAPSLVLERVFCSRKCRVGVGSQRAGTTAPCNQCGQPVYRIAALSGEDKMRFCDMQCRGNWLRGQERVERPEKPCEQCGTTMRLEPDEVRTGKRFCSKTCVDEARRAPVGHRVVDDAGYAWIYVEDEDGKRRRVLEHRWVMEQHLGRRLFSWETVHHKTEGFVGRSNNDLRNLEHWAGRHPSGHRVEDIVAYCREMLALYGDTDEQAHYLEHLASLSDGDAATEETVPA